jgi:hypothetical protein
MKKILLAFLALSTTSLFAQKKSNDIAKLNVETYDYGKIKQNVPAVATFVVTNIGNEPLLIDQATPSCGCTISDYTKTPIAPGKTGTIKATYNAAALGHIDKTLTIKFAGTDDVKFVKLTGEVVSASALNSQKNVKATTNQTKKVKKPLSAARS